MRISYETPESAISKERNANKEELSGESERHSLLAGELRDVDGEETVDGKRI